MSVKRERLSNKLKSLRGNIPLFGVSALIFLLIIAAFFTVDRFVSAYSDKNTVTEWTYVYSDDPDAFTNGSVRTYSKENPIVTEKAVRRDYILFEKRLPPSDEDRILVIITDHSPVRVFSGGYEIYNNRYETSEYTGNCYNAVTLTGTGKEQVVEVYLKLPFSVVFDTYFTDTAHPQYYIEPSAVIGAALCVLSLLSFLVLIVLSVLKKRALYSLSVVFLLAQTGAVLFLFFSPKSTYLLNNPLWMNISYAAPLTLIFTQQLCLLRFCKKKTVITAIVAALFAVSTALILLSFNLKLFNIFSIAAVIIALLSSLSAALFAIINVQNRAQLTSPIIIASTLQLICAIMCGILVMLRADTMYMFVISLSSVAICVVLFFASYFDSKAIKLNALQIKDNEFRGKYIEDVCDCIKSMLRLSNRDNFYGFAVKKCADIIEEFSGECQIAYGAAVLSSGEFTEILNNNLPSCSYALIDKNGAFNNSCCIVSETYSAFIIKDGGQTSSIIYFEGIKNGLNEFFVKMMHFLYCGLQASYNKAFKGDCDVFPLLCKYAQKAEESEMHLQNVHNLTYDLCIMIGIPDDKASLIANASYLHDVGKNALPSELLLKDGRLNEYEYKTMMTHAKFGAAMISAFDESELLNTAEEIANYHHEKYDGSGYYGLTGDNIPEAARIVSVCDVYDALISERPYKKKWSKKDALAYIKDKSGVEFDKAVADAFLNVINYQQITKETVR